VSGRRAVVSPGSAEAFYDATGIPAAVIAPTGERVYVTGHTGDRPDGTFADDAREQIRQTFRNVGAALAAAGASWDDVVELTSYHVRFREQIDYLVDIGWEFLSRPLPAWTAVGVVELFEEPAVVEISCVAILNG
jgi:enamine deaminase RidA (YjgF/YER057c/UK114 family)